MAERNRDEEAAPHGAVPLREQLRRLAEALVVEQQERVAAAVRVVAHGVRHAAAGLEPEQHRLVGRYAEDAAEHIERFSETVRRQRLSQMLSQAEDFARRRPALFPAGAVAGGLVIGRVLAGPVSGATTDGAHERHASRPPEADRAPAHDAAPAMEEVR